MARPAKPTAAGAIDLEQARRMLRASPAPKSAIRVSRDWLEQVVNELANCRARKEVRS